jgi:hypothetical protein
VWQEWSKTQRNWFLGRVADAAALHAANVLLPHLMQEIEERVQQLRTCFQSIKPQYAVFSRRRPVKSEPLPLTTSISLLPTISAAVADLGATPWLPPMSDEEVLRQVKEPLSHRVAKELDYRLMNAGGLSGEDFRVSFLPLSIKKDGRCGVSLCVSG